MEVIHVRNSDQYPDDEVIYIGRGNKGANHMNNTDVLKTGWLGNPYPVSEHGLEESLKKFKEDFVEKAENDTTFRNALLKLEGKKLACYCKGDNPTPCHGDIIKNYVEKEVLQDD